LKVPREKFAPKKYQNIAYNDAPVDIGYGQTMSQPYTVAIMSILIIANSNIKYQISKLKSKNQKYSKVLEIGTGSGYQAAILSYFFNEVYTLEIVPQLAHSAKRLLAKLEYKNLFVKSGSGEWGWKEKAPYDAIMVTAGVEEVPKELFKQLKIGGVLVAPVGKGRDKTMVRYTKLKKLRNEEFKKEEFGTFHFVPFIGCNN
jgi:protein-L-isoaspartate(D-aspartate) O-methyltransferase